MPVSTSGIAAGLLSLFALRELLVQLGLWWSASELTSGVSTDGDTTRTFTIVVSVLREQEVVESLVDTLAGLEYPAGRYRVVIVGEPDEKRMVEGSTFSRIANMMDANVDYRRIAERVPEPFPRSSYVEVLERCANHSDRTACLRREYDRLPTTLEVARERVRTLEKECSKLFHVVESAYEPGKPNSLNYVLDNLDRFWDEPIGPDHLVGVYDADSDIEETVLRKVAAASNGTPVYQTYECHTKNLGDLDAVLASFAITASRYNLGYAMPKNAIARRLRRNDRALKLYHHLVGHGLFVERELLESVGGFEGPNEDIRLGYLFSALDIPVTPVDSLELVEAPGSVRTLIRQNSNWFEGKAALLETGRMKRDATGHGLSAADYVGIALEFAFGALAWLLSGVLIVASFAVLLYGSPVVAVLLYALFCILRYASIVQLESTDAFRMSGTRKAVVSLLWPVYTVVMSLGGLYRLTLLFRGRWSQRMKTER